MTENEALKRLQIIKNYVHSDPEAAHVEADEILKSLIPDSVRQQYEELSKYFWYA